MTQRYSEEEPEHEDTEAAAREAEFQREMMAWRQNPVTGVVRKGLEEQASVAFRNLLSAGLNTTDATVARYASQYDALTKLIRNMKEQPDA